MVGLSIILENLKDISAKKSPQLIIKASMIKPPSNLSSPNNISDPFSPSGFLQYCSLCSQKLSPSKDIYMYKGDRAFCSVECRSRQIFMDEEENSENIASCTREYNCSLAAIKGPLRVTPNPSSPSSSRSRKEARVAWLA